MRALGLSGMTLVTSYIFVVCLLLYGLVRSVVLWQHQPRAAEDTHSLSNARRAPVISILEFNLIFKFSIEIREN